MRAKGTWQVLLAYGEEIRIQYKGSHQICLTNSMGILASVVKQIFLFKRAHQHNLLPQKISPTPATIRLPWRWMSFEVWSSVEALNLHWRKFLANWTKAAAKWGIWWAIGGNLRMLWAAINRWWFWQKMCKFWPPWTARKKNWKVQQLNGDHDFKREILLTSVY